MKFDLKITTNKNIMSDMIDLSITSKLMLACLGIDIDTEYCESSDGEEVEFRFVTKNDIDDSSIKDLFDKLQIYGVDLSDSDNLPPYFS